MLPLRKALLDFLGAMMGPLDLATVMNPITPLSALEWTRDKDELARQLKNYEGRIDNFIGRSPLEESQNLTRNIIRVRSQVVISALHALVMHLAGLREGRKTLLFVSRGIPLMFDISLEPDFQAMLREANRGNVIIHTLDPRGLGQGIFPHDTLYRMAAETGGQAIVNTNNLSAGLERVIRDASHHYLIGYAPTRELNDGKFHRLEVKVKRRGVRTVARKGYWAPTLEELTPVPVEPLEPAVSGALTKLQARQDDRVAHVTTGFAPGADGRTTLMAMWKPVAGFRDRPEQLTIEARSDAGATPRRRRGHAGRRRHRRGPRAGAGRRHHRALHARTAPAARSSTAGKSRQRPRPERRHPRPVVRRPSSAAAPRRRSRRCARASRARPVPTASSGPPTWSWFAPRWPPPASRRRR